MLLLVILWVLFFFLHSVLAANGTKAIAEKWLGGNFRFYRIAYNLLSLIFLSAILWLLTFRQDYNYLLANTGLVLFAGYGLMSAGGVIILLAFKNYDLGVFTGIKQIAQQIHHPDTLMIKGLNKYVRNPLYFGLIVFFAGYFLQQPTYMNLVTLSIVYGYIYIGTKLEEKKLEGVFGEEYRMYKRRVKMLIPFLL